MRVNQADRNTKISRAKSRPIEGLCVCVKKMRALNPLLGCARILKAFISKILKNFKKRP